MATVSPYGSWRTPFTSQTLVERMVRISDVKLDNDEVFWVEMRPEEEGRCAIMHRDRRGKNHNLISKPFSARTLVHEMGGAPYGIEDRDVLFVNMADQRLHVSSRGKTSPVLPPNKCRYADFTFRPESRQVVAVREDHSVPNSEAINCLVLLDLAWIGTEVVLASGYDFYSSPALSPDGSKVAWLCWNHPHMPWDETELWVADLDDEGSPENSRCLIFQTGVSLCQPRWSPTGVLHVISDETGWWNLYAVTEEGQSPLCPQSKEFGEPQWVLGQSSYAFIDDARILCSWHSDGGQELGILDLEDGSLTLLDTPYTEFSYIQAEGKKAAFLGASPTRFGELVLMDLESMERRVIRKASRDGIDDSQVSTPQPIEFQTEGGERAHAFYYPPFNPNYAGPEDELPPLLVKSHGGPTHSTGSSLNMEIQYWTSRGYAVVDVNYRGSTGFGTAYRRRLAGNWGLVDVQDSVHAARHLVTQGMADPERKAVMGGSAGGFTTLACLAFTDEFQAGMSRYGVGDLGALARDTHKFESRYLDSLIGPYPEDISVYDQRSPLNSAHQIACPVLFIQGLEDKIVPPEQAERMVSALRQNGIPVAYLAFPGEQHGFRMSENIMAAIETEEFFLSQIFGIAPAFPPKVIDIDNWESKVHEDQAS